MSQIVERVANAIADADYDWKNVPGVEDILPWGETLARAAIEAMLEPTDAMINAATEFADPGGDVGLSMIAETFRAMIDAALSEKTA